MQEISGYKDGVSTVGLLGWTNSTKPVSNTTGKYLLGYNTQTKQLEIIGVNGSTIQVISDETKKSIALFAHPVGTYYWTSSTTFNPNTAWGGTWVRIQDGRCLISNCSSQSYISAKTVGNTGGTETVELGVTHIPPHQHKHTHPHTHERGTLNITGSFGCDDRATTWLKGAFTSATWKPVGGDYKDTTANKEDNQHVHINFDASKGWSGELKEDRTQATPHSTGGGSAHNNMPPYRVAVCWYRTA